MTHLWSYQNKECEFQIHQISYGEDRFSYVIGAHERAICIDPGEGHSIEKELQDHKLELDAILLTHHHKAHIEDAVYLRTKTEATIVGPKHEELDFIDQEVMDGDEYVIHAFTIQVIGVPGHTEDHVAYYFPECRALFSGDALYLGGCGKLGSCSEYEYYDSLQKLKKLPLETLIFGGHFMGSEKVATLGEEMQKNPCLKVGSPEEFLELIKSFS